MFRLASGPDPIIAAMIREYNAYGEEKIVIPLKDVMPSENIPRDLNKLLEKFFTALNSLKKDQAGRIICDVIVDLSNYPDWHKQIKIKNIVFKKAIEGWEYLQDIQILINNCKFNRKIVFSELEFQQEVDFSNTYFNNVSFHNTVFKDKAFFYKARLKNCDFSQAEFHKKADFRYATLTSCIFQFTEFRDQGAFYGVTFKDEPEFNNLILRATSHLYFEGLNGYWDKKSKAARTEIKKFTLINTVVNGRVDFSEDTIKVLDLKGSSIVGTLTRRDFAPEPTNWETAVILKHEEIKRNNVIEALRYKAIEKDLYSKELEAKKKSLQEWGEYLALKMSWLSNNHGQDWLRALVFTLLSPLIPFLIFYAPMPSAGWLQFATQYFGSSQWMGELIKYFIPTNYDLLTAYASSPNINGWLKAAGGLLYLSGKILIVYGGVEVVQAFRKYNKNPS